MIGSPHGLAFPRRPGRRGPPAPPRCRDPSVRRTLGVLLILAAASASGSPARPAPPPSAVGVAINLDASTPVSVRQDVLEMVRRTGASFFAIPLSWSAAEREPGRYRIEEVTRTARLLRQSGALLELDLALVTETGRDVPADLVGVAFDDPKLSLRLGRLLEALMPALLDFQTLSLGDGADAYFAGKPDELKAYRRLFDGTVRFLAKKVPDLLVGVTTFAPSESPAPDVAAVLHQRSPVLLYSYSPFVRGEPFEQRGPDALEKDWPRLLDGAAGRPIGFPAISYSSSPENGSSPALQAEFIRRMRRFLARADGRKLLFARYVALRDEPAGTSGENASDTDPAGRRRRAFVVSRGLQTSGGDAKPAWFEWAKAGR